MSEQSSLRESADDDVFEAHGTRLPVHGFYERAFRPVVDAFVQNYREEEEVGSAVSVVIEGRTVVDLWGGWTDSSRTRTWQRDTIVCMMSVAKGITAIAFNMLVDRGLVDIDTPVSEYWPEFAQNGKADIPVRWILDHRAGLPVLTPDKLWHGALYDRIAMVEALAKQAPLWEPGTVAAYHVHTQGYLLGEIMLRVSGKLVGPFVRDEIAGPLDADYWIGLPASEHGRCATVMPNMGSRLFAAKDGEEPETLRALAFSQNPDEPWSTTLNSAAWRETEMASGSGHGNARAVARVYGALVSPGAIRGVALMSPETMRQMATMQHDMIELLQERHYRQGLGVLLHSPDAVHMGPNPASFGHHGIGGSIGFGDPDAGIGFSYAVNKMHSAGTNGPRARRLIDALYSVV
ncbi:serine hydrolase domain-containing protein [Okibacterium endophyticum]